jgi:cytochrome oxidase Cu insertion factor (SCO1/SenC/PrrC family)
MDHLATRRALQVVTGTLLGLAVVSVLYLGFPGLSGGDPQDPPGLAGPGALGGGLAGQIEPAPPFSLTDPRGNEVTEADLEGRVSVLFFGFTHCPDVCPLTLANLSRALEALDAPSDEVQAFFVSVDPQRDTPPVLEGYMDRFHPSIRALTASQEEILEVAHRWRIHVAYVETAEGEDDAHDDLHAHHGEEATGAAAPVVPGSGTRPPPAGTPYTVDHTARSLVVDPAGRIVHTLAPYAAPDEIVETLRPLLVQ